MTLGLTSHGVGVPLGDGVLRGVGTGAGPLVGIILGTPVMVPDGIPAISPVTVPATSTSPAAPATTDGQARPVEHARTVRPLQRQAVGPVEHLHGITTVPATWDVRRRAPATRVMQPHRTPVTARQTPTTATNTLLPTAAAATQAATALTIQANQTTSQTPRAHAAPTLPIHPTPAALTATQAQAATVRQVDLTVVAAA